MHEDDFKLKGGNRTEYYSKSFSILQSSGSGKSRLVDELGKHHLTIVFTFRKAGDTGYPPGDPEISAYFNDTAIQASTSVRATCLLSAVGSVGKSPYLEVLLEASYLRVTYLLLTGMSWYEAQTKRKLQNHSCKVIAERWHDLMSPVPWDRVEDVVVDERSPDSAERYAGKLEMRSKFRKTFCRDVCSKANEYLKSFVPPDVRNHTYSNILYTNYGISGNGFRI